MTAGSGIVHSGMPDEEQGLMHGFHLWLNLPARGKMVPASCRAISFEEIPRFTTAAGAEDRIIAGTAQGVAGRCKDRRRNPADHSAFLYVYGGEVAAGALACKVISQRLATLETRTHADGVTLLTQVPSRAHFRPAAGRADHPARAVRHEHPGRKSVQAIADYNSGRMGRPPRA